MNDAQFRRQLANGRFHGAEALGDGRAVESLMRSAAQRRQVFEEADGIWRAVAPIEWQRQTRIDRVERGEMIVAVRDPVLRYHLQQAAASLARAIAGQTSRIRRVRFEIDRTAGERFDSSER